MPAQFTFNPEIVVAIISLAGVVISSLIAWFVSRSTANKEIEKLRLTWQREDVVSSDDEFADMASAVAKCLRFNAAVVTSEALAKVAAVRSKEDGELASSLDSLFIAIREADKSKIDSALTKVIEEKRNAKRRGKTRNPD